MVMRRLGVWCELWSIRGVGGLLGMIAEFGKMEGGFAPVKEGVGEVFGKLLYVSVW